jgi:hypothetical protein
VVERNPFADDLEEVLVRGGDDHFPSGVASAAGERADHVVRFEIGIREDRDTQSFHRLVDERHLDREVIRHRLPVALVVLVLLVPERRSRDVERYRHRVRLLVLDQLAQHLDEAIHRVGRHPRGSRKSADGVVRAIEVVRSVDQDEAAHRGGIVSQGLGARG